jgi:predicted membrane protein
LRLAYQVNRETYATAPYFIWQTPRPAPVYRHEVVRSLYDWELGEFTKYRTLASYVSGLGWKLKSWWQFYLGPLLTVPLLALPWVVRGRQMRLPLFICGAMAVGFAVQTWTLAHYFSPAVCVLYLLLVQGMRQMWHWSQANQGLGQSVVRAIPLVACAMILLRVAAAGIHVPIESAWPRGNLERAMILQRLKQRSESQLVIVRYGPHHDFNREWVYNEADIDAAKVIWARDMGSSGNQELRDYFRDRKIWLVEADNPSPQLQPYPD